VLATRESELRPHAERGFAIPVSRREITSSSRLPPSRSRGAFRRSRGSGRTALEGWRRSIARILRPYSRGFLHSTTSLGTPLDRASPSTSPRIASPDHVNGRAEFTKRGERTACAGSFPISRLGRPEIALLGGWLGLRIRCRMRSFANRLLVSIARHGFPRRASTEPLGMNPVGTLANRRTLFVIRPLPERGGGLTHAWRTDRGAALPTPAKG
jgi:hypothetical protein